MIKEFIHDIVSKKQYYLILCYLLAGTLLWSSGTEEVDFYKAASSVLVFRNYFIVVLVPSFLAFETMIFHGIAHNMLLIERLKGRMDYLKFYLKAFFLGNLIFVVSLLLIFIISLNFTGGRTYEIGMMKLLEQGPHAVFEGLNILYFLFTLYRVCLLLMAIGMLYFWLLMKNQNLKFSVFIIFIVLAFIYLSSFTNVPSSYIWLLPYYHIDLYPTIHSVWYWLLVSTIYSGVLIGFFYFLSRIRIQKIDLLGGEYE